jgi:hypothetical protein
MNNYLFIRVREKAMPNGEDVFRQHVAIHKNQYVDEIAKSFEIVKENLSYDDAFVLALRSNLVQHDVLLPFTFETVSRHAQDC